MMMKALATRVVRETVLDKDKSVDENEQQK